jgi:hypothetical protein
MIVVLLRMDTQPKCIVKVELGIGTYVSLAHLTYLPTYIDIAQLSSLLHTFLYDRMMYSASFPAHDFYQTAHQDYTV